MRRLWWAWFLGVVLLSAASCEKRIYEPYAVHDTLTVVKPDTCHCPHRWPCRR